jgi:hypothetical protein
MATTARVRFNGVEYVWLKNDDGSGVLADPGHISAEGNVLQQHAFSDAYAIVLPDGRILRRGQEIGRVEELSSGGH